MTDVAIQAAQIIRQYEGLRLSAYHDSGGLLSIGYGHVLRKGEPTHISRARAEELLQRDMSNALSVAMQITDLHPQQYAALTSLIYNIGTAAFDRSTLKKRFLETPRSQAKIVSEWRRWHMDNGKPVDGLKNRRELEIQLYKGASHVN